MKKVCLILIILQALLYFQVEQGRIFIDRERMGVLFLNGGYRSYSLWYSEGLSMSDPPKILWCRPRLSKCDVRKLRYSDSSDTWRISQNGY